MDFPWGLGSKSGGVCTGLCRICMEEWIQKDPACVEKMDMPTRGYSNAIFTGFSSQITLGVKNKYLCSLSHWLDSLSKRDI